ncbi:MAG: hypothetical protein E6Q90_10695 [Actinobacteria bacterium]|nr:MAG: hypothetical protein E6Q90_10695 [Actinomycetota bacterium]
MMLGLLLIGAVSWYIVAKISAGGHFTVWTGGYVVGAFAVLGGFRQWRNAGKSGASPNANWVAVLGITALIVGVAAATAAVSWVGALSTGSAAPRSTGTEASSAGMHSCWTTPNASGTLFAVPCNSSEATHIAMSVQTSGYQCTGPYSVKVDIGYLCLFEIPQRLKTGT